MKQLGYVRVDRLIDDDNDQHDALRGNGVRRANIFTDVACGMTPASSRPGWRLLLEELRRGDSVVVTNVNIFGDDPTDVALTLGALEHMGISVRAIRAGLDTSKQPGPTLEALASMLQPSAAQNSSMLQPSAIAENPSAA
jgi:DNA invertase Pin-like site-specific DNA recombinase